LKVAIAVGAVGAVGVAVGATVGVAVTATVGAAVALSVGLGVAEPPWHPISSAQPSPITRVRHCLVALEGQPTESLA
jgi:hypothetical protein